MNSEEQEEQIDESNEPMSFENDDLEGEITTVNPVEETIQPSTIPTEPIASRFQSRSEPDLPSQIIGMMQIRKRYQIF